MMDQGTIRIDQKTTKTNIGRVQRRWIPAAVFLLLLLPAATSTAQMAAAPADDPVCEPPTSVLWLPQAEEQLVCRNFVPGEDRVPYDNEAHLRWFHGGAETYDVYFGAYDAEGNVSLEKIATTGSLELFVGVECSQAYAWKVVAKNDCGEEESEVRRFETLSCTDTFPEWECHPPAAEFTWNPEQAVANQPVQLQAQLSDREREFLWDFGDGSDDPFETHFFYPIHIYEQPGTYEVELQVGNPVGSDSITKQIQVAASSPLSLPEGRNAFIGEPLSLEAQATGCAPDPDGWLWDLAGGEAVGDATGATISAVWSSTLPRQERVVVVRNTACGSAAASMLVVTAYRIPISGPTAVQVGDIVGYSAIVPSDPSVCLPDPPGGYRFFWAASGTILTGHGTDRISVAWNSPGPQVVELRIDQCPQSLGLLDVYVGTLTLDGPDSGDVDEALDFTASAPGCGIFGESWSWDVDGGSILGAANRETVSVRWPTSGTKQITVHNSGCGASGSRTVTIGEELSLAIAGPETARMGEPVEFTAIASGCSPVPGGWSWTVDGGTVRSGEGTASIVAEWSDPGTKRVSALNPGCGAAGELYLEVLPNAPRILSVERQLKGILFAGVHHSDRFRAEVEWNGTPHEVRFQVGDGVVAGEPGDENGASHEFLLDRDFPAKLGATKVTVTAVNREGALSEPFVEEVFLVPHPPWLRRGLVLGDGWIEDRTVDDTVVYRIDVPHPLTPVSEGFEVPGWVPFLSGRWGIDISGRMRGEVQSSGAGKLDYFDSVGVTVAGKPVAAVTGKGTANVLFTGTKSLEITDAAVSNSAEVHFSVSSPWREVSKLLGAARLIDRYIGHFPLEAHLGTHLTLQLFLAQDTDGELRWTGGTGLVRVFGSAARRVRLGAHRSMDVQLVLRSQSHMGLPLPLYRGAETSMWLAVSADLDGLFDLKDWTRAVSVECSYEPPFPVDCFWTQIGDSAAEPLLLQPIVRNRERFGPPSRLALRQAAGRATAGSQVNDLISNVFPSASPAYVELPEGTLLLWEDQDPTDPVHQSLDVAWSVDRGNGWSQPRRVVDDTRVELSPVAAAVGDGRVAAAWLRVRDGAYPGPVTTLEEADDFYRELEVVTALFDPATDTWTDPVPLTDDRRMDDDLKLSTDGPEGRLMLTWLSRAGAGLAVDEDSPARLLSSFWNAATGRWTPPRAVAEGLRGAVRHAAAVSGDTAYVVLERRTGEGPGRLELFRWDGRSWSRDGSFAPGPGDHRSPWIAFDSEGGAHLLWLRDGDLVHAAPEAGPVLARSGVSAGLLDAKLLASPAGPLALVWPDAGEDGAADPTALFWDPASRAWSEPRPLDPGPSQAEEIDGFFDRQGRLHLAYVSTEIERKTEVVEIGGQSHSIPDVPVRGRSDLRLLQRSLSPDPAILPESVTLEPARPFPGDPVQAGVVVRNAGDLPARDLTVKLFAGQAGPEGQLLGSASVSGPVAGGASVPVSFDVTYPAVGGNLIAMVEPIDGETSEDNNQAVVPLANQPPVAVIEASAISGPAPLTVTFNASASSDPEGGALTFHWSFGDGAAGAQGPQVSHTFQAPGVYPVTVLVSDGHDSRLAVARVEVSQGECGSGGLLCLEGGRFHVRAFWRAANGEQGIGRPADLTRGTGHLWFFHEESLELAVRILDGCALNDRFWVFASGMTDFEVELTVHDTWSGETWTHRNPLGLAFPPVQDKSAFATCGAAPSSPERM